MYVYIYAHTYIYKNFKNFVELLRRRLLRFIKCFEDRKICKNYSRMIISKIAHYKMSFNYFCISLFPFAINDK